MSTNLKSFLAAALLWGGTCQTSFGVIVTVPNPGTPTEIGIRARNGLSGAEVILFDSRPTVANKATLNPTGTPVWTYGQAYPFAASWNSTTGALSFSVDFGKNGTAGDVTTGKMRETVTYVYPEFIGTSFTNLSIMAQGKNSPSVSMNLSNLVFNGVALSNLSSSNNTAVTRYYANSTGEAFSTVSLTGELTLSGNGGVAARPQMEVRLSGPVALSPAPEPTTALLVLAPAGLLLRRQRRQ